MKRKAQKGRINVVLPERACVQELKKLLVEKMPELENDLRTALVSINKNIATEDDEIPENAEVAFFPPISGG